MSIKKLSLETSRAESKTLGPLEIPSAWLALEDHNSIGCDGHGLDRNDFLVEEVEHNQTVVTDCGADGVATAVLAEQGGHVVVAVRRLRVHKVLAVVLGSGVGCASGQSSEGGCTGSTVQDNVHGDTFHGWFVLCWVFVASLWCRLRFVAYHAAILILVGQRDNLLLCPALFSNELLF